MGRFTSTAAAGLIAVFFVAALVVAPASAATGDESVIASEVFAFVNDEREARGLAALPDQAPGTGSVQGVYGVVTAPSGAAVVQMMGDDYRRAIILDADALSMQVRATCDGGELTVRVGSTSTQAPARTCLLPHRW